MRAFRLALPLVLCLLIITLTGCSSDDDPTTPPPPPKTPLAIDDLRVTDGDVGQVTLLWTSPELEDKADYSVRYDLRTMPYGSEGAAWDQWMVLDPPSNDTAPGISHSFVVRDLTPDGVFVFMLRASSDGAEWSGGSNMAVGTAAPDFDTTPPEPITDLMQTAGSPESLSVRWSTVGGDGPYGHAPHYQIRYSQAPITEDNWDEATFYADISVTGAPSLDQTITGLTADTEYYVAVKASDDAGNVSDLSNVLALTTVDFRVIHVYVDGSGDQPTIQKALQASRAGDLILVGPGRYTWTNQGSGNVSTGMITVPVRKDSVELRSTHGASETILDAERNSTCLYVPGGTVDPPGGERYITGITIDGFTFTGGLADGEVAQPDKSWAGGGVSIHLSDTVVRNCVFNGNEATEGGALWVGGYAGATIEDCVFINNKARYGGAAVIVNSRPRVTMRDCVIRDNTASYIGGGLMVYHSKVTLENLLIFGNRAVDDGGGLAVMELVLPDNEGGEIIGCTIVDNEALSGSGIYFSSVPEFTVTRTIVAYNTGGTAIRNVKVTGMAIGCTDLFGNPEGGTWWSGHTDLGGNIELDPLFCNRSSYMLQSDSPCLTPLGECGQIGARGQGCSP